jgi:hypothetical protein
MRKEQNTIKESKRLVDNKNRSEVKPNYKKSSSQFGLDKELESFKGRFFMDKNKKLKPEIQTKRFKNKGKYEGTLTNEGLREGVGVYSYDNRNDVYFGEWKNDVFEGEGSYFYHSGDVYKGELHNGFKHGKGIYYYSNGNIYDGEWEEDFKHGYGKKNYRNLNESYEG